VLFYAIEYEQRYIWGATANPPQSLRTPLCSRFATTAGAVRISMKKGSVASADWFKKPQTQAIYACLNREGFAARAVGGAVRNALLGRAVHEVDFATTAKPEEIMRLAAQSAMKAVPTGIAHGTVTLVVDGIPFEVTSLRRDVETHGRHATVAFDADWESDAKRRDFTINALYADTQGNVHDPVGGLADLGARRVRFVGKADERVREDYLRILRFFRFSAEYAEGDFDREGIAAAIHGRGGLAQLSRERIRAEFLRLLVSRRAGDAITIMDEAGLLLLLLGRVIRRTRFARLGQIESRLCLTPDPILRLAALAIFVAEDAVDLAERLRLSSAEAGYLLNLATASPSLPADLNLKALRCLIYRQGSRVYLGRLLLAWASFCGPLDEDAWTLAAALVNRWKPPSFPLSGADLIAKGWKAGPELGAELKRLEDLWIDSDFELSGYDLLMRLSSLP
jgi:poly(A) polymerase